MAQDLRLRSDPATEVRIPPSRLLKNGKVRIWSLIRNRYEEHDPIQAKELIFYGEADHFAPGDEPNFRESVTPETPTVPPPKAAAVAQMESGQGYLFSVHTVEELRQFAYAAGVQKPKELKREELISALERSGYRPSDGSSA
jgi:hypothetical protein